MRSQAVAQWTGRDGCGAQRERDMRRATGIGVAERAPDVKRKRSRGGSARALPSAPSVLSRVRGS
eukprot:3832451-Prymnesium_polylepis.1